MPNPKPEEAIFPARGRGVPKPWELKKKEEAKTEAILKALGRRPR